MESTTPRFTFKLQKLKDWLEWLTVLKRHTSVCPMVMEKNEIYLTHLDENVEDGLHISLHKNMVEEYHCKVFPTVFGMDIPAWIDALRFFKNQHVRLLEIHDSSTTHEIVISGYNPDTKHTLTERVPIVDVDSDVPAIITNIPRTYPFYFELQSKSFHQHCRKMAKRSPWVRMTLDLCKQELNLEPLSDINTAISSAEMPVKIIPNPSQRTALSALLDLQTLLHECNPSFTMSDIRGISNCVLSLPVISIVVSSTKLLQYSHAHKLNSFVRCYLQNNQELLMKFILRQSPDDDQESSRLEAWLGFRVEKKNEAVLQTESFIQCFDQSSKVPINKKAPKETVKKAPAKKRVKKSTIGSNKK